MVIAESTSLLTQRATMFKALGEPTRLRIFEFLCSRCGEVALDDSGNVRPVLGPTVGEVCCQATGVEQAPSTISFHLKELRVAGLIRMERRGKQMICSVSPDAVELLTSYFAGFQAQRRPDDCCY